MLDAERDPHLTAPARWRALFRDRPGAVESAAGASPPALSSPSPTWDIVSPTTRSRSGRDADRPALRHLTYEGARSRWRPSIGEARAQLEHELTLIEKLELAGYFLIVWDLVRYAARRASFAGTRLGRQQRRLLRAGITAVDAVRWNLSSSASSPKNAASGRTSTSTFPPATSARRSSNTFSAHGARGAAMTANVITYRGIGLPRNVEGARALARTGRPAGKLSSVGWYHDPLARPQH